MGLRQRKPREQSLRLEVKVENKSGLKINYQTCYLKGITVNLH